jgi:hypothetical protein
MVEIVTNKITAVALWIPEGWHKYGFTEEEIETAIAHAVHEKRDYIVLKDKVGNQYTFNVKARPLEFKSESYQGVLEINTFTLGSMTRHYVSIEPEGT